ncbi:MAG: hypothetical protein R3B70_44955 [Polyangiaceae bacterium]
MYRLFSASAGDRYFGYVSDVGENGPGTMNPGTGRAGYELMLPNTPMLFPASTTWSHVRLAWISSCPSTAAPWTDRSTPVCSVTHEIQGSRCGGRSTASGAALTPSVSRR